ncbi:MAG: hypothetical protein AB7K71_33365 [Polyangiaceae bacterium]
MNKSTKANLDNRANQLNPNNAAYQSSRGATPGQQAQPSNVEKATSTQPKPDGAKKQ